MADRLSLAHALKEPALIAVSPDRSRLTSPSSFTTNVATRSAITLVSSDLKADLRELELRIEQQIERILIVRSATLCRRRTMALYTIASLRPKDPD
jgi:hypothetical protein